MEDQGRSRETEDPRTGAFSGAASGAGGVFGMYDFSGGKVASAICCGLLALQHRGEGSCGIAVSDTDGPKGAVRIRRGAGPVRENFSASVLSGLTGDIGVGHVGCFADSRTGAGDVPPLVLNYLKGTLSLALSGVLVNASELRHELARSGAIFRTSVDSEIIAYHIARARVDTASVEEAVSRAAGRLKGAYSFVVMSPRKLIGARDPFGFRPLCIGKKGKAYILSSESCALDAVGAEFVRDVEPGEIVTISPRFGIHSDRSHCQRSSRTARCIFEYLSFGRPDSEMDRVSVYRTRIRAGMFLAEDSPADADLVIGVPGPGTTAALGYSMRSGIPYGQGFYRNGCAKQRSVPPDGPVWLQDGLNPIRAEVEGKRVVVTADPGGFGRTAEQIVRMLRSAGAAEVHVRLTAPPVRHACPFGTDLSVGDRAESGGEAEEIRARIGADSFGTLAQERLPELTDGLPVCSGCCTGVYPDGPALQRGLSAQSEIRRTARTERNAERFGERYE